MELGVVGVLCRGVKEAGVPLLRFSTHRSEVIAPLQYRSYGMRMSNREWKCNEGKALRDDGPVSLRG